MKGATTIKDVLRDRTVQWTDPFRSVLPAFAPGGARLETGKAANSKQLSSTLTEAALMVDIVDRVTPHALRRGAQPNIYATPDAKPSLVRTPQRC
jgi:hypothetical protein